MYQTFFKSLSNQMSNFVNTNSKLEINAILNICYHYLCAKCPDNKSTYANVIIKKLMSSSCFSLLNSSTTAYQSPTKITNGSSNHNGSFFQFAFKFLVYIRNEEDSNNSNNYNNNVDQLTLTQLKTIKLFNKNLILFIN